MNFNWILLFWFLKEVASQDSNCDFHENVASTMIVDIMNPNYPNNYGRNLQCRWIVDCPTGYNCRLDCPEISLPQSTGCMLDKLLVSKSGDSQLAAADTYCGNGPFSVVSTRQRIVIGLKTTQNTTGGKFRCEVSAQPVQPVVGITSNCNCGLRRQSRITGGTETGINEYPMMVGIVDVRIPQIVCGGTIISNHYVLTAARCLARLHMDQTLVLVGEHDVNKNDSPATKTYSVTSFSSHPQYSSSTYDYNVGVIRVSDPIEFNDRVGPVCLPFKFSNDDFRGKTVTILGWGNSDFTAPVSSVLRKVDLKVINMTQCMIRTPSVTYRQICTFKRGKGACQEDAGGPLLYTDPQTGLLFSVGILSNRPTCGAGFLFGVDTRVTVFLDWIVEVTRGNYCIK